MPQGDADQDPKTSQGAPASGPRKPTLKAKLLLFATTLFILLGAFEIFVRLTWVGKWGMPADAMVPPGIYMFRLRPNIDVTIPIADVGNFTFHTNADGFRGTTVKEIADKPLKVISLGDSITFAWGLEQKEQCMERFVDAYQRRHPESPIGHAVVALPGWGPNDYLYAYNQFLEQYNPDVIVLGFFAGNDVLSEGVPLILDPDKAPSDHEMFKEQHSLLKSWQWAKEQVNSSLLVARVAIKMGYVPSSFTRFDKDLDRQRKQWQTSFFFLKALKEQTKAHNTRLVMLSWPSLVQVNIAKSIDDAGFDHAAPDALLREFCKENNIDLIELLKPMQAANNNNDLFWRVDRHPTAKGHEVVAKVLEEKLSPILDEVRKQKAATQPVTQPFTSR